MADKELRTLWLNTPQRNPSHKIVLFASCWFKPLKGIDKHLTNFTDPKSLID